MTNAARPSRNPAKRLSAWRLGIYALPALPLAALTLPLYMVVPTFYTDVLGLPLGAVGVVLLAVRLIDAISDPCVGWMADRYRPAFGRRRTAVAISILPTAVSAYMLLAPPAGAGLGYLFAWATALAVSFTVAYLPYVAWGAELETDYRGRSRVAGFRECGTLIGTLVAIALPFAIDGGRVTDSTEGWHGLAVLGLSIGLVLVFSGGLALAVVPEPDEHSRRYRIAFREGLAAMAANRPFLRLIAAYLLNGLANGVPATLFLYFVEARFGLPDWQGPLLFTYFACGVLGVPLALFLSRQLSKHRAWCWAMLFACAVFVVVPFLTGPMGAIIFAVIVVVTGLALGFDLSLPSSIQADVIDIDTAATGEQRSGLYFSAWSLATKLSLALGVGIAFPILQSVGFNASDGTNNSGTALFTLAALYGWTPIVFKLIAIALMWNFPLDEDAQTELRSRIETESVTLTP
ncbi:MFS transporter [Notoacmeibacter ruber]|uniref:MFS transporter n=1 Tax=Notoacmeibacter ruber TaxID=2670375 RepID=A0A3L7JCJ6_9HYPH|nr:MFS transporter [Notoacmeibacter ruber]RLQ88035.1 MFS transporter [Notoacmeibacter ruber]